LQQSEDEGQKLRGCHPNENNLQLESTQGQSKKAQKRPDTSGKGFSNHKTATEQNTIGRS